MSSGKVSRWYVPTPKVHLTHTVKRTEFKGERVEGEEGEMELRRRLTKLLFIMGLFFYGVIYVRSRLHNDGRRCPTPHSLITKAPTFFSQIFRVTILVKKKKWGMVETP